MVLFTTDNERNSVAGRDMPYEQIYKEPCITEVITLLFIIAFILTITQNFAYELK